MRIYVWIVKESKKYEKGYRCGAKHARLRGDCLRTEKHDMLVEKATGDTPEEIANVCGAFLADVLVVDVTRFGSGAFDRRIKTSDLVKKTIPKPKCALCATTCRMLICLIEWQTQKGSELLTRFSINPCRPITLRTQSTHFNERKRKIINGFRTQFSICGLKQINLEKGDKIMKRKSIFTFCAIALMLVLSLSVLTACNKDGKDELVVETEYTITFDSKGGSAVQPVKASAGAAITAPADPTKDGFVFAGWYESTDGGVTLSDTAFSFSYMPARVFTLYAKWATADIKGKTFNKVDATFEWESEAVKQALLAEMEMTEEQFIQTHKVSKVTLVFAADKDSVTATFDQHPGEEDDKGKGVATLLYKIKGSAIVFYDSQEDMEKEIPAHETGLFVGSTFELSADKTTIIQSNIQPGMGTIKYKYSVVVK